MIYFFTTQRNALPLCAHRRSMAEHLRSWFVPLAYESLAYWRDRSLVAGGTYVFTDTEVLSAENGRTAAEIHALIRSVGGRVLNDPSRVLTRSALLTTLKLRGINSFDVGSVDDRSTLSFPVFLRSATRHEGSYTSLIYDRRELERALTASFLTGRAIDDLLVVEFCDVADREGLYRKYGAFIVGETVIPRHVFFGRSWMVKQSDLETPELLAEELEYIRTNPHEAQLREIARVAGIDYGRIDYGILGGRIQVWEFNTNPVVGGATHISAARRERTDRFLQRINTAFEDLAGRPQSDLDHLPDPCRDRDGSITPSLTARSRRRLQLRQRQWFRYLLHVASAVARPLVMAYVERRHDAAREPRR